MCENLDTICGSPGEEKKISRKVKGGKERSHFRAAKVFVLFFSLKGWGGGAEERREK